MGSQNITLSSNKLFNEKKKKKKNSIWKKKPWKKINIETKKIRITSNKWFNKKKKKKKNSMGGKKTLTNLNVQYLRWDTRYDVPCVRTEVCNLLSHNPWLQHVATSSIFPEPAIVQVHHQPCCLVVQSHYRQKCSFKYISWSAHSFTSIMAQDNKEP